MSNWKLQSPDSFPPSFPQVIRKAFASMMASPEQESEWIVLDQSWPESKIKTRADRFRCFRWNLRRHPMHELHRMETFYEITLRRKTNFDGTKRLEVQMRKARTDDALLAALQS